MFSLSPRFYGLALLLLYPASLYLLSNSFHIVRISNAALYQYSPTYFHPNYQHGALFRAFTIDRTRFRHDFLSSLPQPVVRLNPISTSSSPFSTPTSLLLYTINIGGGLLTQRKFDLQSPLRVQALANSPSIIALLDVHLDSPTSAPSLPNYTSFYSPPWLAPHARPSSSNSPPRRIGDRLIYVRTRLVASLLFSSPTPHLSIIEFPTHHLQIIFVYYPTVAPRYRHTILRAHRFLLQHLRIQHNLGNRFILIGDFNATPIWAPRSSGLNWADRSLNNIITQLSLHLLHPISSNSPPFSYSRGSSTSLIDLTIHSTAPTWLSTPPTSRLITSWAQADHYAQLTSIPHALSTSLPTPIYYPPYFLKINSATLPAAADLFEELTPTLLSQIANIMRDSSLPMQRRINYVAKLTEFTIFLVGWDSGTLVPKPLRRNHTGHAVTNPFILQIATQINSIKAELLTIPSPTRTATLKAALQKAYDDIQLALIKAAFTTLHILNNATETAYLKRDLRTFWERLKTSTPQAPRFPNPNGTLDPSPHTQASIVKDHFYALFNRPSPPLHPLDRARFNHLLRTPPPPLFNRSFTSPEILQLLQKKKKVAKGIDGMPPTLWLDCMRRSPEIMTLLINLYLATSLLPTSLTYEKLTGWVKPKKPPLPSNLRGISVLSIHISVVIMALASRISKGNSRFLPGELGGFIPHRSFLHSAFVAKTTMLHLHHSKTNFGLMFYDVAKCFDSMTTEACLYGVAESVGTGSIFKLCQTLYSSRRIVLKWDGYHLPPFLATRGRPQGANDSVEFPKLFTCALPQAFKLNRLGVTIMGMFIACCIYADDVLSFFLSSDMAIAQHDLVKNHFARFALSLNDSKLEIYLVGDPQWTASTQRHLSRALPNASFPSGARHLGVYFSASPSTVYHFNMTFRKGYAQFLLARDKGILIGSPNPLSLLALWRNITAPSILYAAPLQTWTLPQLGQVETMQLRFCSAALHLPPTANRALTYTLLGIKPIYIHIHGLQLKFFARLLSNRYDELSHPRDALLTEIYTVLTHSPSINSHPPRNRILRHTLTANVLSIAYRYNFYRECLRLLRSHSEMDSNVILSFAYTHIRNTLQNIRQFYLEAVSDSSAPISPFIIQQYTHTPPSQFQCLIESLLPPFYPTYPNSHKILRVYFSLLYDIPHWHFSSHVTDGTCPLCTSPYIHAGYHLLYKCTSLTDHRPPIPRDSSLLSSRTERVLSLSSDSSDIIPYFSPSLLWLFSLHLSHSPELWTYASSPPPTATQLSDVADQIADGFDMILDTLEEL